MTKRLNQLATGLQRTLLEAPWPTPPALRVMVDAWASLVRWHESGDHVYRVRSDVRTPAILPELVLASAPVAREGVCYVLDRDQWIIIARHAGGLVVPLRGPERIYQYPAPVLTYCTEVDGRRLASGYVNLHDQPTPRHLHMIAGTSLGAERSRSLTSEEVSEEGLRLARVLPWYYDHT